MIKLVSEVITSFDTPPVAMYHTWSIECGTLASISAVTIAVNTVCPVTLDCEWVRSSTDEAPESDLTPAACFYTGSMRKGHSLWREVHDIKLSDRSTASINLPREERSRLGSSELAKLPST